MHSTASITFLPTFPWVERILSSHLARVFAVRNYSLRYVALLLSLTLATACVRLPEYAKPRTVPIDEIHKVIPTGFTYRQLTTEDFRATSLPENLSAHAE